MDNNKVLIICLTVIVVLGIFLGAFYIMNSNNSNDMSDNSDLNLSDISEDNSSEIKKAYMDSDSQPAKHLMIGRRIMKLDCMMSMETLFTVPCFPHLAVSMILEYMKLTGLQMGLLMKQG